MEEIEKMKLTKSIVEIQNKIINYDRNSAIELIKRVREDHKGKEQIAYVLNNIPFFFQIPPNQLRIKFIKNYFQII